MAALGVTSVLAYFHFAWASEMAAGVIAFFMLLEGLERQLMLSCQSAGLRKIILKPGRWYEGAPGIQRVRF